MEVRLVSRYSTIMNPSGSSSMMSSLIEKETICSAPVVLLAGKNRVRTVLLKSLSGKAIIKVRNTML